jgi:hypothetical protein
VSRRSKYHIGLLQQRARDATEMRAKAHELFPARGKRTDQKIERLQNKIKDR